MVGFADPFPQQRVTVFFRLILMIPHAFVLWVLGIVAEVVAVIGWFGALFTGRLPQFAAEYLTGYVRWQTRYNAYYLLLTDQYPPFTLEDASYPVRLLTRPGRLNRLAVLSRLILGIPALIVTALVGFGLIFFSLFIIWLIVLFTGTMPTATHQALAAITRYFARFYGYMLMLTSEYPKGLFGDGNDPAAMDAPFAGPAAAGAGEGFATQQPAPPQPMLSGGQASPGAAAGPGTPTVPAGPAPGPAGYPSPATPYPAASYQAPAAYQAASPSPAASPSQPAPGPAEGWPAPGPAATGGGGLTWRLVLSATARRLVGLFLGLGVIGLVACIAVIAVVASGSVSTEVTRHNAINQIQSDNTTLSRTLTPLAGQTSACQSSQDPLHCITALDRKVGGAFHTFASNVRSTPMPAGTATAAASQLASSADQAGRLFQRLGFAKTAAQYQSIVSSSHIDQVVGQVGTDYQDLGTALNARQ